jgi:acyl transferase domain-containing protein
MTIRTACSSALTCLHQACLSIQAGDCDSAIVGGTNLVLTPDMTVSMFQQGVLSPEGRCKTFDASADGYARGEAVVALHVKRLRDAIRDNDPIRAIIRSSCANADGKTAGMAQPSSISHAELIRKGHSLAGIVDHHRTAMIECHGTGTQIGDTLETAAVASVFKGHGVIVGSVRLRTHPCFLTLIVLSGQTQYGPLGRCFRCDKHHQSHARAGKKEDSAQCQFPQGKREKYASFSAVWARSLD